MNDTRASRLPKREGSSHLVVMNYLELSLSKFYWLVRLFIALLGTGFCQSSNLIHNLNHSNRLGQGLMLLFFFPARTSIAVSSAL